MLLHLQEEIHVRRNVGAHPSGVLELPHLRQAPRRGDLVPRLETRYADVHRVMPPGLATGQDVTVRWLRDTRGKPKPRHGVRARPRCGTPAGRVVDLPRRAAYCIPWLRRRATAAAQRAQALVTH